MGESGKINHSNSSILLECLQPRRGCLRFSKLPYYYLTPPEFLNNLLIIRQTAWSGETGHPTLKSNGMLQGL